MSGSLSHPVEFQSCSSWQVKVSKKNHSDGNYIFWPDQAGCHYIEHSLDFLCENLIHHADKVDNFPEVRPKEDLWSILKAKVYENNWEAKTLLEVRINETYSSLIKNKSK